MFKIQRQISSLTPTMVKKASVTTIKEELKLTSLQERRCGGRLDYLYKVINDHVDIDHTKYIKPKLEWTRRDNDRQCHLHHTRTHIQTRSSEEPSTIGMPYHNSYPRPS